MTASSKKTHLSRTLETIGLSENEALLYTIMLRYPKCSVQELNVRAPFPRTMLYHILDKLIQHSLVTSAKTRSRTLYIAENPDRLYELLAKKREQTETEIAAVRDIIPTLKHTYRLASNRPDIRLFEGLTEYQKALDTILRTKPTTIATYLDLSGKRAPSGIEIRESFDRRRVRHKITQLILTKDTPEARKLIQDRSYDDYTQFRFTATDLPLSEVELHLYDDTLISISYDEHAPTAILLEDIALANMQRYIFERMWKESTDVTMLTYT